MAMMPVSAFAQITISQADMPSNGDTLRFSTSTTAYDYTATGAAYTWNFDTLKPNGQGRLDYKSSLSINPVYSAFFGLTAYGAKVSDGLSLGPLSISNIYNFYKKTSSKFTIEGYGAELASVPTPATYSDEDELYQFPLTYNRRDTSTFNVLVNFVAFSLRLKGSRINYVDGCGSITTPFGTYNCIRLKSVVNEIDSVKVATPPLSFGFPRNTVTYQWLANGIHIPVLEVQGTELGGTFTPTLIRYRDTYREIVSPFAPVANLEAARTWASLSDTLSIFDRTGFAFGNSYKWQITPGTFSYVNGTTDSSQNVDVKFSNTGLYSVRLRVTNAFGTDDTLVNNYITVVPTSIEDIAFKNELQISPNPVSDVLYVSSKSELSKLQIIQLNGVLVSDINGTGANEVKLSCSQIPNGTYLLRVEDISGRIAVLRFNKN